MRNGYRGVQIGSNVNNLNLGEPGFDEFFAACAQLNAAVLVHPWQMMGQEHMQKYWLPWLVGMPAEISRAIPAMKISSFCISDGRYFSNDFCCLLIEGTCA